MLVEHLAPSPHAFTHSFMKAITRLTIIFLINTPKLQPFFPTNKRTPLIKNPQMRSTTSTEEQQRTYPYNALALLAVSLTPRLCALGFSAAIDGCNGACAPFIAADGESVATFWILRYFFSVFCCGVVCKFGVRGRAWKGSLSRWKDCVQERDLIIWEML